MTFFLLITANVGSIFEDPRSLLKPWICEFMKTVRNLKPNFIALHCQEFGGKNFEKSFSCVDEFLRILLSSNELQEFEHIRVFLDENFSSNEKFTALGSFYFVHKSKEAFIWDFQKHVFMPVIGKEIHSGNIETVPIKHKMKFPQDFFPQCKWSRKGLMKTRWLIEGTCFDLINIHLFHDESNFVSISEFPSVYAKTRIKALEYAFNQLNNLKELPLFVFGDFNFRLNSQQVIKHLTNNAIPSQVKSKNGEIKKLVYCDHVTDRMLLIEKKQFYFSDQNFFKDRRNLEWLLEQDKEPSYLKEMMMELKINFMPSYPFEESVNCCSFYMNTRCPAWCDRVLMNELAKKLFEENVNVKYDIMGFDAPMGDHKPVYVFFDFTALPPGIN